MFIEVFEFCEKYSAGDVIYLDGVAYIWGWSYDIIQHGIFLNYGQQNVDDYQLYFAMVKGYFRCIDSLPLRVMILMRILHGVKPIIVAHVKPASLSIVHITLSPMASSVLLKS